MTMARHAIGVDTLGDFREEAALLGAATGAGDAGLGVDHDIVGVDHRLLTRGTSGAARRWDSSRGTATSRALAMAAARSP